MGQRQKLFDDVSTALEWMNNHNFREFVEQMVQQQPDLVDRLKKEIAKAEKKQLTSTKIPVTVLRE